MSGITTEKVFKKAYGGVTDEKRVEELLGQLEDKLDVYEAILGKQKYLAGDVRASSCQGRASAESSMLMSLARLQNVTVVDLFHLPHGNTIFGQLGYGNLDKRPNVKR